MSADYPLALLDPALNAAVAAMAKMEEREVPAKLRSVASKQGQKLPPPLARGLVAELDASEWLREKSLERLAAGPSPAHRMSELFLSRPEGWEEEAAAIAEGWEGNRLARADEGLGARVAKAERQVEELSQRLQREQEKHRADLTRLEEEKKQAVATAGDGAATARRLNESLRSQLAAAQLRVEELDNSIATTLALVAELKAGARPRRQEEAASVPPSGWSLRGSPERLARHLDEIARAAAVQPTTARSETEAKPEVGLAVPSGVRPDRAEAIEWLRRQTTLVLVVVDGWNVAYQMEEAPDGDTQLRVVAGAQRLAVGSQGFKRVTVLFDSGVAQNRVKQQGVEVRYVPSADEEAIDLSRRSQTPVVVITSDRRVREEVESHGGVGLWSEAFVGWLGVS